MDAEGDRLLKAIRARDRLLLHRQRETARLDEQWRSPVATGRRRRLMLERTGVEHFVHGCEIGSGRQFAINADELVVMASVFKVVAALELFRQGTTGLLNLAAPVCVPAAPRTPGPTGLSAMRDPVVMSLRDLAYQMLAVSDNVATDVILEHVRLDAVQRTLDALGLVRTRLMGDCRYLLSTLAEDLGELERHPAGRDELSVRPVPDLWQGRLERCRALRPAETSSTTPREFTALLAAIWRDEAGPSVACAAVRELMLHQPSRFARWLPGSVRIAAKSGWLADVVANEVAVIEFPDGGVYAVGVFTRSPPSVPPAVVDEAIGALGRECIEALRSCA